MLSPRPCDWSLSAAGRDVGARRVAGHEVADAHALVREQALAVRQPADDLRGVGGVARDHQLLRGRARTSGTPGCRRCCRGGSRPGWPRSSTAGSPPSARACAFRSRTQRAHRVDRSRPDAAGEDRVRQPVDLDDHEPRRIGLLLRLLGQQARDEEAEVGPAAVDAEDRRERGVDGRVDERADRAPR